MTTLLSTITEPNLLLKLMRTLKLPAGRCHSTVGCRFYGICKETEAPLFTPTSLPKCTVHLDGFHYYLKEYDLWMQQPNGVAVQLTTGLRFTHILDINNIYSTHTTIIVSTEDNIYDVTYKRPTGRVVIEIGPECDQQRRWLLYYNHDEYSMGVAASYSYSDNTISPLSLGCQDYKCKYPPLCVVGVNYPHALLTTHKLVDLRGGEIVPFTEDVVAIASCSSKLDKFYVLLADGSSVTVEDGRRLSS